jgi:hypothetical protein
MHFPDSHGCFPHHTNCSLRSCCMLGRVSALSIRSSGGGTAVPIFEITPQSMRQSVVFVVTRSAPALGHELRILISRPRNRCTRRDSWRCQARRAPSRCIRYQTRDQLSQRYLHFSLEPLGHNLVVNTAMRKPIAMRFLIIGSTIFPIARRLEERLSHPAIDAHYAIIYILAEHVLDLVFWRI